MTDRRVIFQVLRRIAVALVNRTSRAMRRNLYISRIPAICREAHIHAPRMVVAFDSLLLMDGCCDLGVFKKDVVDAADRVVSGAFVLFGEWFEVPEASKIDGEWSTDFLTGHTFPAKCYTELHAENGIADIKVPWEYGRMQYLVPLAAAYRARCDKRYLDALRSAILRFHAANPLGVGVQWVCTMEVGIRIFNMLAAYELIHENVSRNDELHVIVAEQAYLHAAHIWANLETSAKLQENNHYIADLLGLSAVVACYPGHPKAKKWGRYVKSELMRTLRKQVLHDGCCFERSTRYTRLVGEMLFYAGKSISRTPFSLPNEYFRRLTKLGAFLESVTNDKGDSLQLGDNDSGRVIVVSPAAYNDLRLVGRLIAREAREIADSEPALFPEEALLYGAKNRIRKLDSWSDAVRHFPDSGIALVRKADWSVGLFACDGFKDGAEAGHTHNDKLSVVLDAGGESFFVDPGSGVYTRDASMRNRLRGTSQHSTLWFDGAEQNEYRGLFGYARCGGATLWIESADERTILCGETDCWTDRFGVNHKRTVVVEQSWIRIEDVLAGAIPEKSATRSFVLAPSVSVTELEGNRVVLENGAVSVSLEANCHIGIREGLYSAHYGSVTGTSILDLPYLSGTTNVVTIERIRNAD